MLELPIWFHELASLATVAIAAAWLTMHWLRVGKPRGGQPGCARCDRNALVPIPVRASVRPERGRRSRRLRVL